MGGQACVFYGAAEFTRDVDLLVLLESDNLARVTKALQDLQAEPIAVPAFDPAYLDRGHSIHFRCHHPDVNGLRVDLMSRLRGVDDFETLWERRTSIEVESQVINLLSMEDLVNAKKTQRDKDWPMIRRLVERSYFTDDPYSEKPSRKLSFWLRELRTPELLISLARAYPAEARLTASTRPAIVPALAGNLEETARAIADEEAEQRHQDRLYWEPLKRELEQLRQSRKR